MSKEFTIKTKTSTPLPRSQRLREVRESTNNVRIISTGMGSGEVGSGGGSSTPDLSGYATKAELDSKVDKVTGKGLSTNDFTNTLKNKLSNIGNNAQPNVIEKILCNNTELPVTNKQVSFTTITPEMLNQSLANKVDKQGSKVLSTNDFTDAYKEQIDTNTTDIATLQTEVGNKVTMQQVNAAVSSFVDGNYAEKEEFTDLRTTVNQLTIDIEQAQTTADEAIEGLGSKIGWTDLQADNGNNKIHSSHIKLGEGLVLDENNAIKVVSSGTGGGGSSTEIVVPTIRIQGLLSSSGLERTLTELERTSRGFTDEMISGILSGQIGRVKAQIPSMSEEYILPVKAAYTNGNAHLKRIILGYDEPMITDTSIILVLDWQTTTNTYTVTGYER